MGFIDDDEVEVISAESVPRGAMGKTLHGGENVVPAAGDVAINEEFAKIGVA